MTKTITMTMTINVNDGGYYEDDDTDDDGNNDNDDDTDNNGNNDNDDDTDDNGNNDNDDDNDDNDDDNDDVDSDGDNVDDYDNWPWSFRGNLRSSLFNNSWTKWSTESWFFRLLVTFWIFLVKHNSWDFFPCFAFTLVQETCATLSINQLQN